MNPEKLVQIKDKISKLIALGESEAKLGNEGAAALMAEKVQDLMRKYQLEEADFLSHHPEVKYEPLIGVSVVENIFLSKRPKETRKEWAEFLASQIAFGSNCKVTVNYRTGELSFYGVDFNRDIAILMFNKLGTIAYEACKIELEKAKSLVGKKTFDFSQKKMIEYPKIWMGDHVFTDNFMLGFGNKLRENYEKTQGDNSELFNRIDVFINAQDSYYQLKLIELHPSNEFLDVIALGARYGNFTAKQKSDKVQKSANIEFSKQVDKYKPLDDRIGEVYLLIDDSGSMCGSKIQDAKLGAIDFAEDSISKKFAVGIIGFDHNPTKLSDPVMEIDDKFKYSVNSLCGRGGTAILNAMVMAGNTWKSYHRFRKTIVLLTDGHTQDPDKCIEYAKLLKASGIQIITIGTYDADSKFLKELSSGSNTLQISDSEIRGALKGAAKYLTA